MTTNELLERVASGETLGLEFKSSRKRTDRVQFHYVAKAVLGMANRRDGGQVLIGVRNDGTVEGLSAADEQTWEVPDDVRASLAPYADPFVEVGVELVAVDDQRRVAVIGVLPFESIPVLCGKDGKDLQGHLITRKGALYVRAREGVISTVEAHTQAQMREVLDTAAVREARRLLRQAKDAGLNVEALDPMASSETAFQSERQGFDD